MSFKGSRGIDRDSYLESRGFLESAGGRGLQWIMPECVYCGKDRRLYVDSQSGHWICYSCNNRAACHTEDGEVNRDCPGCTAFLKLVREIEGLETDGEALRLLLSEAEKPKLVRERPKAGGVPDYIDAPLPEGYEPVWNGKKYRMPTYLKERGVTLQAAREFELGFCRTGRLSTWPIIFPIDCPKGKSFQRRLARKLDPDEDLPRYLSGPWATRLLFGWKQAMPSDWLLLVEGPMDAISAWQAGFPAVAIMGKTLKGDQVQMIRAAKLKKVVVLLDSSAFEEALKVAGAVQGPRAFVARLEEGDPGEASPEALQAAVDAAIPHDRARLTRLQLLVAGRAQAQRARRA